MKRFIPILMVLSISISVFSQTKMFINKTNGTDSLLLSDIKSIYFKTYSSFPTQGLVAWYPLNGNANDSSGNGNNGTSNGGITWVADRNGNSYGACSFNGSNTYINIPNSTSMQIPSNQLTFSLWFKCIGTPMTTAVFFSKNDSQTDYPQYSFQLNPLTTIHFGITDTTNNLYWVNKDYNLVYNQWYFIAVTWDGVNANLYLNDSLISTQQFNIRMKKDNHPLQIGRDTGGDIDYYQGYMDDIRIYSRALSTSEIKSLYNYK